MKGMKSVGLYVLVAGLGLFASFLPQQTGAARRLVDGAGAQTDGIFQEIGRLDCVPSSHRPPSYSQPGQPNPIQVKHAQWNPQKELIAIWCTNTPDLYIFDAANFTLKYTLLDPTPQADEIQAELSWSPNG